MKPFLKYDDSLDAFGIHGVGGFLGAVLTGVFCYEWTFLQPTVGKPGLIASDSSKQVLIQLVAAVLSAVFAFTVSLVMVKVVDLLMGFMAAQRGDRGDSIAPSTAKRASISPMATRSRRRAAPANRAPQ